VGTGQSELGAAASRKAVWWDLRLASPLTHLFCYSQLHTCSVLVVTLCAFWQLLSRYIVLVRCSVVYFFYFALLWPPCEAHADIIFCPVVSIFLLFSSRNISGPRLDVYHTSTHGVVLVRI